MAEIINLRQARKAKVRTEAETAAAQNSATYGRTKAERLASAARTGLEEKRLASHRLEKKPDPGNKSDT